MLDRLGRMVVVALALPVAMRDKARALLNAERERDMLRGLHAETVGGLDEARAQRNWYRDSGRVAAVYRDAANARATALRDEVKIVRAERDGYLADVQRLTDRAEQAERYLGRSMQDSASAVNGWMLVGKRLDALQSAFDDCYALGWRAIIERDTARSCLGLEHGHATNEERRLRKALAEAHARADRLIAERDAQGTMP